MHKWEDGLIVYYTYMVGSVVWCQPTVPCGSITATLSSQPLLSFCALLS